MFAQLYVLFVTELPIGETVTVLCGLVNDGDAPINVTNIQGSLNSPFDFNFYLMNVRCRLLDCIYVGTDGELANGVIFLLPLVHRAPVRHGSAWRF